MPPDRHMGSMPTPDVGRNEPFFSVPVGDSGVFQNMISTRQETDAITIPGVPAPSHARHWKLSLRDNVASAPWPLDEGFVWSMETEAPGATLGKLSDNGQCSSLYAKLASALSMILAGETMRAINSMKEHFALEGKPVKGREILSEVYKN